MIAKVALYEAPKPHLQVILPMHQQPVAKHVPHDDHVCLLTVHPHTVHTQELWQQGATVTLHYVLQGHNSKCQVRCRVD